MHRKKLRVLSAVVASSFFFQDISMAAAEFRPSELQLFQQPLVSFELPKSIATIGDTHKGLNPETIILVQDAHTNDSAQINTSKALHFILQKEEIPFIYLEAASGNSSLAIVRDKASLEKRKQVAMKYLRKGTLDGVEYLDMTSNDNFIPWGVEDKKLYLESLHAYEKVAKNREKFKVYLGEVARAVETLKPRIYGPSLQEFDQKRQAFLKTKLSLTEYIDVLMKQMDYRNIAKTHYPHLLALSNLKEKEKTIDFDKANDEQMDAMATLSDEDQEILQDAAMGGKDAPFKLSVQDNKTQKAFYALLEEKLDTRSQGHKVTSEYPELKKYFEYLKETEKINAKAVMEEQKLLEEEIYASLAKTEDEQQMHKADTALLFLQKLFDLTVTPDQFRAYKNDREAFDIKTLTGFLNRKIMDLGDFYDRVTFLKDDYEGYVQSAEDFYRLTYQRDQAFLDKMYAKMRKEGQKTAVLVTGGYHTPNLTGLLRDKSASYIVVTPQVLKETNRKKYESLLLGQNEKDILAADNDSAGSDAMDFFQSPTTQTPVLQDLGVTRQALTEFRSKMSAGVARVHRVSNQILDIALFRESAARTPGYARTKNWNTPSNLLAATNGARLVTFEKMRDHFNSAERLISQANEQIRQMTVTTQSASALSSVMQAKTFLDIAVESINSITEATKASKPLDTRKVLSVHTSLTWVRHFIDAAKVKLPNDSEASQLIARAHNIHINEIISLFDSLQISDNDALPADSPVNIFGSILDFVHKGEAFSFPAKVYGSGYGVDMRVLGYSDGHFVFTEFGTDNKTVVPSNSIRVIRVSDSALKDFGKIWEAYRAAHSEAAPIPVKAYITSASLERIGDSIEADLISYNAASGRYLLNVKDSTTKVGYRAEFVAGGPAMVDNRLMSLSFTNPAFADAATAAPQQGARMAFSEKELRDRLLQVADVISFVLPGTGVDVSDFVDYVSKRAEFPKDNVMGVDGFTAAIKGIVGRFVGEARPLVSEGRRIEISATLRDLAPVIAHLVYDSFVFDENLQRALESSPDSDVTKIVDLSSADVVAPLDTIAQSLSFKGVLPPDQGRMGNVSRALWQATYGTTETFTPNPSEAQTLALTNKLAFFLAAHQTPFNLKSFVGDLLDESSGTGARLSERFRDSSDSSVAPATLFGQASDRVLMTAHESDALWQRINDEIRELGDPEISLSVKELEIKARDIVSWSAADTLIGVLTTNALLAVLRVSKNEEVKRAAAKALSQILVAIPRQDVQAALAKVGAGARLATPAEIEKGRRYHAGESKTKPTPDGYKPVTTRDVKMRGRDFTAEELAAEERLGAQAMNAGKGVFVNLIAGASSRMNPEDVPDDVHRLAGGEIGSKAAVPIGEWDGKPVTYLGEDHANLARLSKQVEEQAAHAGIESHVWENEVLHMTNEAYKPEHLAMLAVNNNYGLRAEQIKFFEQPLGPVYYARPEAARSAKYDSEEQRPKAVALSEQAEVAYKAGDYEALIIPGERQAQGHGELFHQIVANGKLLNLIDSGREWLFVRNIDNVAAKYDKGFLRNLGYFLSHKLDFLVEGAPTFPGHKGGKLYLSPANNIKIDEDPNAIAAGLNPQDSAYVNNAVAFFTVKYIINLYKQKGQSDEDFIAEYRAADDAGREAIAQRGRAEFPLIWDAKASLVTDAAYAKGETNMWQSLMVANDEIRSGAIGVDGAMNFDVDAFLKADTETQFKMLPNLRFIATKNWNKPAAEIQKAKASMEASLGRPISDNQLAIAMETYVGNRLLYPYFIRYSREAELVTPGILGGSRLSAIQVSREGNKTILAANGKTYTAASKEEFLRQLQQLQTDGQLRSDLMVGTIFPNDDKVEIFRINPGVFYPDLFYVVSWTDAAEIQRVLETIRLDAVHGTTTGARLAGMDRRKFLMGAAVLAGGAAVISIGRSLPSFQSQEPRLLPPSVTRTSEWLKNQINPKTDLVESFTDLPVVDSSSGVAWMYNQAQAIQAFLAINDVPTAERLARGLLRLQRNNGAWFDAYLEDSGKPAEKIEEQKGNWVGPNMAIGHALMNLLEVTDDQKLAEDLLKASIEIAGWLDSVYHDKGSYGYVHGGQGNNEVWTEHNQRVFAFYYQLYNQLNAPTHKHRALLDGYKANLNYVNPAIYKDRADKIIRWIQEKMWSKDHYLHGYTSFETEQVIPDIIADLPLNHPDYWQRKALGYPQYLGPIMADIAGLNPRDFARGLDWLMARQSTVVINGKTYQGFPRWLGTPSIWGKGTSEAAVALSLVGRQAEADQLLTAMEALQSPDGGILAAAGDKAHGWPIHFAYPSVEASSPFLVAAGKLEPKYIAGNLNNSANEAMGFGARLADRMVLKYAIDGKFLESREGGNVTVDTQMAPVPTKKSAMEYYLNQKGFSPQQVMYFGNQTNSLNERDGIVASIKGIRSVAVDEDQEKVIPEAQKVADFGIAGVTGPEATEQILQTILALPDASLPKAIIFDVDDTILGLKVVNGKKDKETLLGDRKNIADQLAALIERNVQIGFFSDNDSTLTFQRVVEPLAKLVSETSSSEREISANASGMVTRFSVRVLPKAVTFERNYDLEYQARYMMPKAVVDQLLKVLGGVEELPDGTIQSSGLLGEYYTQALTYRDPVSGRFVLRPEVTANEAGFVPGITDAKNVVPPQLQPRDLQPDGSAAQVSILPLPGQLRRNVLIKLVDSAQTGGARLAFNESNVLVDLSFANNVFMAVSQGAAEQAQKRLESLARTNPADLEALLNKLKGEEELYIPGGLSRQDIINKLDRILSGARMADTLNSGTQKVVALLDEAALQLPQTHPNAIDWKNMLSTARSEALKDTNDGIRSAFGIVSDMVDDITIMVIEEQDPGHDFSQPFSPLEIFQMKIHLAHSALVDAIARLPRAGARMAEMDAVSLMDSNSKVINDLLDETARLFDKPGEQARLIPLNRARREIAINNLGEATRILSGMVDDSLRDNAAIKNINGIIVLLTLAKDLTFEAEMLLSALIVAKDFLTEASVALKGTDEESRASEIAPISDMLSQRDVKGALNALQALKGSLRTEDALAKVNQAFVLVYGLQGARLAEVSFDEFIAQSAQINLGQDIKVRTDKGSFDVIFRGFSGSEQSPTGIKYFNMSPIDDRTLVFEKEVVKGVTIINDGARLAGIQDASTTVTSKSLIRGSVNAARKNNVRLNNSYRRHFTKVADSLGIQLSVQTLREDLANFFTRVYGIRQGDSSLALQLNPGLFAAFDFRLTETSGGRNLSVYLKGSKAPDKALLEISDFDTRSASLKSAVSATGTASQGPQIKDVAEAIALSLLPVEALPTHQTDIPKLGSFAVSSFAHIKDVDALKAQLTQQLYQARLHLKSERSIQFSYRGDLEKLVTGGILTQDQARTIDAFAKEQGILFNVTDFQGIEMIFVNPDDAESFVVKDNAVYVAVHSLKESETESLAAWAKAVGYALRVANLFGTAYSQSNNTIDRDKITTANVKPEFVQFIQDSLDKNKDYKVQVDLLLKSYKGQVDMGAYQKLAMYLPIITRVALDILMRGARLSTRAVSGAA